MKVLFVEDEQIIKMAVILHFKRAGFDIMFTENGKEALAVLNSFDPDVVITDIMMPVMDGIELARRIKKEYGRTLPVVFASGNARSEHEEVIRELKIDGYFEKPYKLREITDYIKQFKLGGKHY